MPNASKSTVDVSKWANIDGQSLLEVSKHIAAISESASSPIRLSPHGVSDRFYAVINGMALGHMRASSNTPLPILHSGPTRTCCSRAAQTIRPIRCQKELHDVAQGQPRQSLCLLMSVLMQSRGITTALGTAAGDCIFKAGSATELISKNRLNC
jgi:hypothetical protein